MEVARTKQRLTHTVIGRNAADFCKTYHVCQNLGKPRAASAKLQPLHIIEVPLTRMGIDIIVPLNKPTRKVHKFILFLVFFATRFLEVVPLNNTKTFEEGDALLSLFYRCSIPKENVTEMGVNLKRVV